jgi:hypothetical protein
MASATKTHLFHRYLGRLCSPKELWENTNYAEDEDDSYKRAYITLYMANWALGATHPVGLVLDQDNGTAMQHMGTRDTDIAMNGRQIWLSLEEILDGYIDMIDQGKIVAVDDSYSGEQERTEPWIMPSYMEQDLKDTLQAFEQLVDVIHHKMPSQPQSAGQGLLKSATGDNLDILPAGQGLLKSVTGGNSDILPTNSFAHRFLAGCSRPRFTYIAPGLSISQHQPFAPVSGQVEPNELFPLLLFSSIASAYQETQRAPWGEELRVSPFAGDFDVISPYPAGLYLTETNPHGTNPFEDGSKLILPFTLGSNAFARTADNALIGEFVQKEGEDAATDIEPKSTELYQLGFNHFIARHDVQLKYVLRNWLEMITEGKWEVDEHGVIGGIEKWREADTEEHWYDYQLLITW